MRKYRRVRLNKETIELLELQRQAFKEKFGREPGPEDPIFFDENSPEPRHMLPDDIQQAIVECLTHAKVDPAFVHAFQVTGRLVTEENLHLLTEAEIQEWTDAVQAYRSLHTPLTHA
jgi:hypothetical protein